MSRAELDKVLLAMLATGERVSDINFSPGRPPQMEVDSQLVAYDKLGVLTAEKTKKIAELILAENADLLADLELKGSCDCSLQIPDGPRFRVNVFKVDGACAIVLRSLPTTIPTLESLKLPEALRKLPELKNGLVLVTGGTGSGKSTTLAAVIDAINSTRAVHIVTLEDPIEFKHPHKQGTINQRELGKDFKEFADGLRAALRQAPKVILVGEMRDRMTVEIAMKAAETGHLVLSTLHTIDAGQTINRIVGMFEASESSLVRGRLAQMVRYVVGQRLLPKEGGGRIAALEIMGNDTRVREIIAEGEHKERTYAKIIAESRSFGWQTFDQHIADLFEAGLVSTDIALAYATDRAEVRRQLDQRIAKRGQSTSDIGNLEMAFTRRVQR
ncbi:MAG: PilT/PilU family type 4a pilus ATPase [Planctomycetes bacterium]|nr:PilT/PilU family type 4a pilus ATPase [Planctomycetota bacterium]